MPEHDSHSILVVEDDPAVRNLISTALESRGYQYATAETGNAAIASAATTAPDIVLLDLGLPDVDGVDVIRRIRTWSNMPIIVISARSDDSDKIDALDAGADDYLTKPFSVGELLARLRTTERHLGYMADDAAPQQAVFTNGGLVIDFAAGTVGLDGRQLHLTPMEYKLLCLLAQNTDRVLTHQYILKEVWGTSQDGDLASLRVFMGTLRKKIEKNPSRPRYIQTHVGVGYRMVRI
jgi:two-component system KDP operon response regulator KdpE